MLDKHLLDLHPLLSRLSGEVIWMLFEEEGVDASRIDSFFAFFEQELRETVELIRRLSAPENLDAVFVRIERNPELAAIAGDIPACPTCAALAGKVIPAATPGLMRWLPPFSLGCRLRAVCISADEAANAQRLSLDASPPDIRLACESGWLFRTDWSALHPTLAS